MPGNLIKITPSQTTTHQWWDLAKLHPIHGRSESSWIEEFNFIIDDAVRLRMRSDVPFGAFLSGGVDSSTVVGLMAKHMTDSVKTFCIGFDDPRFDEAIFAQEAATRFSTDHTMLRVNPDMLDLWPVATYHCDQPHGDVSFLPTFRVSELAAKHVTVVLTGDGADELFAGYEKYQHFFSRASVAGMSDIEFQKAYFRSISLFNHEDKLRLFSPNARERLLHVDSFEVAQPYFDAVPHQDRINQALYLDMQLLLSGNNLVKPDRMGMAVSLEARTPFLDYRMMEFAFRMPGELKLREGVTKYLYKKAVEPLIGKDLAYRKKQMFTVPVGEWFKSSKREYCEQMLSSLKQKYDFCGIEIDRILSDHLSGNKNNTRELRALLAFSHHLDVNASVK